MDRPIQFDEAATEMAAKKGAEFHRDTKGYIYWPMVDSFILGSRFGHAQAVSQCELQIAEFKSLLAEKDREINRLIKLDTERMQWANDEINKLKHTIACLEGNRTSYINGLLSANEAANLKIQELEKKFYQSNKERAELEFQLEAVKKNFKSYIEADKIIEASRKSEDAE